MSKDNSHVDLCSLLGEEVTCQYIVPIYKHLLIDTCTRVRLFVVSNFDKINSVIHKEMILTDLLPAIVSLKNDIDWRVRQALLSLIPNLAQQFGQETTYRELRPILNE